MQCAVKGKDGLYQRAENCSGVGCLAFDGDIAPDSPTLSGGFVILDGVKRSIVQGTKHRNPDGTVNFTELDVI